jgi:hypothetical protein
MNDEIELRYGCNPDQVPARAYWQPGVMLWSLLLHSSTRSLIRCVWCSMDKRLVWVPGNSHALIAHALPARKPRGSPLCPTVA